MPVGKEAKNKIDRPFKRAVIMEKKIVLVVEDNHLNMKLVKTLLESNGYEVLGATEAATGIKLAKERNPSLILMDLQLPGMDGLEATRIIKNDKKLKNIPVIAVTAFAMPCDREAAVKAGCDGYIQKPIDPDAFVEKVNVYLGKVRV